MQYPYSGEGLVTPGEAQDIVDSHIQQPLGHTDCPACDGLEDYPCTLYRFARTVLWFFPLPTTPYAQQGEDDMSQPELPAPPAICGDRLETCECTKPAGHEGDETLALVERIDAILAKSPAPGETMSEYRERTQGTIVDGRRLTQAEYNAHRLDGISKVAEDLGYKLVPTDQYVGEAEFARMQGRLAKFDALVAGIQQLAELGETNG